jgi:hypothetical protein
LPPLALATFAVGTDAFVIAGLLPAIAADLEVSIPAAGQLTTGRLRRRNHVRAWVTMSSTPRLSPPP